MTIRLGAFLCNNYCQALDVLQEQECPFLEDSMKRLEVTSESVFDEWLKEEEEYLTTLSEEPLHKTLEMEYYMALLDLFTLQ